MAHKPALWHDSPMKATDRAAPWAALFAALISFGLRLHHNPFHPTSNSTGWWLWTDQGLYLRAAQAWSAGVLDGSEHWYFPGYALLAAPFVRLLPQDPFVPVDALCLAAATMAFCALAQRLTGRPGGATLGAMVWVVTVAVPPLTMRMWVEPWTTTPTAALTLLCLWLLVRLIDRPSARDAALLGLAASAVLLFRPADAAILLAGAGAVAGAVTIVRRDWRSALAGLAGAGAGFAMFAVLYVTLYGLKQSPYLAASAEVGFEWRLLWLRWVTLVIDPAPLVPNEIGLARAFWWVLPGTIGLAACLTVTRGTAWLRHAAVIGILTGHTLLYLSYRDLHPQGLIRYGNVHYFKWVLPVLGLYAAWLVLVPVWGRARRLGWSAAAAAALLFCWRAEFAPDGRVATIVGPHTVFLPDGFGPLDQAVRIMAQGSFEQIYLSEYALDVGGVRVPNGPYVKAEPIPGGFLLVALRPLPSGPAAVQFPDDVMLDVSRPPAVGRQRIVFEIPLHGGWPSRAAKRLSTWVASR